MSSPARGRPRSERARAAILAAAAELLLTHGLGSATMDAVATEAGVSKATIYRWWPNKETLALDALHREWATGIGEPRDTGSLRGDLMALLHPWVRRLGERPYGEIIGALVTQARSDPEFAREYLARFVHPRRAEGRAILERALARGELEEDLDLDVALDLIYGPIYHRLLHGHAPLQRRFIEDVVDLALSGIAGPR